MNPFSAARCLALSSFLVIVSGVRAENWPQWRGPNNDGVSAEKDIPVSWGADKNIAWKLAMPGDGSSTPCVWGKQIFLTSQDGGKLVLISASTEGKELWRKTLGNGGKIKADEGNEASASPSTDGTHVYAFAGTGDLACFDFAGKEIWRVDLQQRYGQFRTQFGMHSTPVLYGDRVYLQLLHSGGQFVIALDKENGKEIWKVERKSDGRAECLQVYASAMMWHSGDKAYLVVHGNDYTTAHDLKDGSEIWRVGNLNPKGSYNATLRFVASPLCTPDLIVIPTAKKGQVVGIKPDVRGTVKADSETWRLAKGTPDVPSPLLYDGLVYLCGEQGSLTCLDAKTAKIYYEERIHSGRHRASPAYVDGKILCVARDGVVSVVQPGKEFKLLSSNRMNDDITASPAISGGRIYLRGWKALYAIGSGNLN
jgi:outer membrane protein assembly factor BamB